MKKIFFAAFFATALLVSCDNSNENDVNDDVVVDTTSAHTLVFNEGNYGSGNSSLSAISFEGALTNDLFQTTNGIPIGDVGQSITYINGKYYLVLNSGKKIQVIGADDYKLVATISLPEDERASQNPMYMAAISDTEAIVTRADFYTDYKGSLTVINTTTDEIVKTIDVDQQCITTQVVGDKLFVNSPAVYDWSNWPETTIAIAGKVLIFDTNDIEATPTTIEAGMVDKCRFAVDKNGKVWGIDKDNDVLYRINPTTETLEATIALDCNVDYDGRLVINSDGDKLYFNALNSSYIPEIYSMDIDSTTATMAFTLSDVQTVYNMEMSPEDELYVCDALDYSQSGYVFVYSLDGSIIEGYSTGVSPNDILFTENN
ncbi:MAG: hypothetical protein R3Y50_02140 [Rikenellaceae bacterium]